MGEAVSYTHLDVYKRQSLDRYVGNYEDFQRVYEVKKSQLEAAYKRQQQEISQLKDFVARNKARVSTRNMAMSRQKKLDKMEVIELAAERPKPEFHFKQGRTPGKYIFETRDFVIGYDEPLSKPLDIFMERGQKIALTGANGIGKTTLIRSCLLYTSRTGENLFLKHISGPSADSGKYRKQKRRNALETGSASMHSKRRQRNVFRKK